MFLHLYPDASDAVSEYGNRAPFDAQHKQLGRVNVKTAKAALSRHGKDKWSFALHGGDATCETFFLVGFNKAQTNVSRAWLCPSSTLPPILKVMSPESACYTGQGELSATEVLVLDRKFQSILTGASAGTPVETVAPREEYERVLLGRIGEALYHTLYPDSKHVSAGTPNATYDFVDPDGTTVNVRVRRLSESRNRWTFFRTQGCTAKDYFFIGMDRSAKVVEALLRVPAQQMPEFGFSLRPGSASKWLAQGVPFQLPQPVANFVDVSDLESSHLEITGLTTQTVTALSDKDTTLLLHKALKYHRSLGFPYPEVPSDKHLAAAITAVRASTSAGQVLPVDNAGISVCSAYMKHRFGTRNADADFSALQAFENDVRLERALRFCLRGKNPVLTRPALRSALTALNRTPMQFRPTVAKILVDQYCPAGGVVFDPCAGWGGRMFGTLVSGRSYVGVEPNTETVKSLHQVGGRLCEFLALPRSTFRILEGTIQEVPDDLLRADFAITSPPYWTKEVYGGTREDTSVQDWVQAFLVPMFKKVKAFLKPDGYFAVNIADIQDKGKPVPLESLTTSAAESTGFHLETTWRMMKSSFGAQEGGRSEPILVFRIAA